MFDQRSRQANFRCSSLIYIALFRIPSISSAFRSPDDVTIQPSYFDATCENGTKIDGVHLHCGYSLFVRYCRLQFTRLDVYIPSTICIFDAFFYYSACIHQLYFLNTVCIHFVYILDSVCIQFGYSAETS